MVDIAQVANVLLSFMRLILFALSLGLTVISFQAYSRKPTDRLQYAFIGFAFISMGVAVTNLNTQITEAVSGQFVYFQIAETVPFIVGFSMIYLSLYR
jgi:multisubunit Na+/H+ antiporter MnhB subunit